MGIQDASKLFEIKSWCDDFNRSFKTDFKFIVDSDTQKSKRILINDKGDYKVFDFLTKSEADKLRSEGFEMYVPDLADYKHKVIIEWQEEPKPNSGYLNARITKKGHDEFSDLQKDAAYKRAGFSQLKLWETQTEHKLKLFTFLYKIILQTNK